MRQKLQHIFIVLVCALIFLAPSAVLALNPGPSPYPSPSATTGSGGSPVEDGLRKVEDQFPTSSKLAGSRDVSDFIINVIEVLLTVAMAIAVLFIIIGGFQYMTSAGNEGRAESGKKTLINALIGLVLIILAYVIVSVINRTLTN
jgi:type IV secretory pathway VirB2 component (pilin)